MEMKKILILMSCLILGGCYDSYVQDFDHDAIGFAYQFDLRTFVVGEGMEFEFSPSLVGVRENRRDRKVGLVLEPELLTEDLRQYYSCEKSFTAIEAFHGKAPVTVAISQNYVSADMAGAARLEVLPENCYTLSSPSGTVIKSGSHTSPVKIRATEDAFLALPSDPETFYALGIRISDADADQVPLDKSFEIIAVRYENMLFGFWYHGGMTTVTDPSGKLVSKSQYELSIPQSNDRVYSLTTVAPDCLITDKIGNAAGSIRIKLNGDDTITVDDPSGNLDIRPHGEGSRFLRAGRLEDRKIFLGYEYDDATGNTVAITDTLVFRNRIRDGVNEWQN